MGGHSRHHRRDAHLQVQEDGRRACSQNLLHIRIQRLCLSRLALSISRAVVQKCRSALGCRAHPVFGPCSFLGAGRGKPQVSAGGARARSRCFVLVLAFVRTHPLLHLGVAVHVEAESHLLDDRRLLASSQFCSRSISSRPVAKSSADCSVTVVVGILVSSTLPLAGGFVPALGV